MLVALLTNYVKNGILSLRHIAEKEKEDVMDELSSRECELIEKIRATKNPKQEITYIISVRDQFLQHDKQRPLLLPAPRAVS